MWYFCCYGCKHTKIRLEKWFAYTIYDMKKIRFDENRCDTLYSKCRLYRKQVWIKQKGWLLTAYLFSVRKFIQDISLKGMQWWFSRASQMPESD